MDEELRSHLAQIEKKLDETYRAAEKSRKYLFWTGVVTIALIVLPAIGLVFAIPSMLSTYSQESQLLQ